MKNLTYKIFSKRILLIVTCVMLVIPTAQAKNFSANLVGVIGNKFLDNDWQEFDSQIALGASFDFKYRNWPFSLAIATIVSADVESNNSSFVEEETGFTSETHLGIRKILTISGSPIEPYIGGGLALVRAELDRRINSSFFVSTDDDFAVGFWVGGGLYWHITERLNVGFDIRYSDAEVTLFGTDLEAGGLYTSTTVGVHW